MIEVRQEPPEALSAHARISIAFEVDRVLAPKTGRTSLDGIALIEVAQDPTYIKDYDAITGNRPADWVRRFGRAQWALLSAWRDERRVGGAVVVAGGHGLELSAGRSDLAVLWDMRVAPQARRMKVGSALFAAARAWAREQGARQLVAETQNVNVAACRFYASQGCELGAIHRFAYPLLPDELQMLWYTRLG